MDITELEKWGGRIAAWSRHYLTTLRRRPVRAQVRPLEISEQLPAAPPKDAEPFEHIFADFEKVIMPGMTHWQHPRFFAYFPANSSPPSVLAEWLTAVLSAQCMLWQTSPAATELETVVIGWLRQMLGLPETFTGVIHDSASSATLAAVLTMRERALNWTGNTQGLSAQQPLRIYCSQQVHSSIDKACRIAGIGQENLVKLPSSGPHFAIDITALRQTVSKDLAAGRVPAGIIASIGGTSVGGSDDLSELVQVAQDYDLFVHVDAAWAGSAMICPEFRSYLDGIEGVDSFVVNPHKWLFTNFDCTAYFIKDPASLSRTLALRPSYLETPGEEGVLNYSEWSVPLGRRFRALKLWFVIRAYGVSQLQQFIRQHVAWSRELAKRLEAEPDFEIMTQPMLSLFTFRHRPKSAGDLNVHNAGLLQRINDDGRIYLTQTMFEGQFVIRFQAGQTYLTREDVDIAFDTILEIARRG